MDAREPALCDPVTMEIVKGALRSAQAEMEALLSRTAMSPFIREKKDYYVALFDAVGALVIGTAVPIFGDIVGPVIEHYPLASMRPGDLYWYNDCYGSKGAVSHSPDQVFLAPVFVAGELVAFAQSWAHFNDIGGMRPGSLSPDATDIYQEGIIIPPIRLAREGVMNDEAVRIFTRNCRFPQMVQGDIRAGIAAVRLGEKRLQELFQRFGTAIVQDGFRRLIDETERVVRRRLAETFPPGEVRFTERIDTDGHGNGPFAIRLALARGDNGTILDASETDDQSPGPINFLMNPDVPRMIFGIWALSESPAVLLNAGALKAIDEVRSREGSLLQPRFPAPLGQRGLTMVRVVTACNGLMTSRRKGARWRRARSTSSSICAVPIRAAAPSCSPTGSASASARGLSPTASTPSISSRRRTTRPSSSTRPIRCACVATPSIAIPAARAASAAGAASCARSRCSPRRRCSRTASTASRIRRGASPAAAPDAPAAPSSTRAAPTSACCRRSATARSSGAATSSASRPAAAAGTATPSIVRPKRSRRMSSAASSASRRRKRNTASCSTRRGSPLTQI
jgi:hypothetical protein